MGFEPETDLSAEEVHERVDTAIEENDVVPFMKGTECRSAASRGARLA